MSNYQKTDQELEIMKKSGKICSKALKKVLNEIKPGVKCSQLDKVAFREIIKNGAEPSFMTVEDYKWTICTTINEQVVHGIPTDRVLKDGDIVGIDIGALYKGFHSDLAITIPVGKISKEVRKFLETGKNTLQDAIKMAKVGNRIGDISHLIQSKIEQAGYSIVKSLTGHGVGRELHEEPMIPGFGKSKTGPALEKNMALAIEVIYAMGSAQVGVEKDNWTISTVDKSLGALFEQTIALKKSGPIVLTPYI